MSIYLHKSHNVSVLLYHLVFPTKYRRLVVDDVVDKEIKDICLEIGKRYEIHLLGNTGMKKPSGNMLKSKDVHLNMFRFTKTN